MTDMDKIDLFLTLIPTKNIEALKSIDEGWTDWLIDYLNPLSLPINDIEQIPFYHPILKEKYDYENILSKKVKLDINYRDHYRQFQFHKTVKSNKDGLYYKIPCDQFKQVVFMQRKWNEPVCNTELPNWMRTNLAQNFPVNTYLIGVQCKDIYWYQYLSIDEVRNKKVKDRFEERVVFTRNILSKMHKKYTFLEGFYQKAPDGFSLMANGDFFESVVVDNM